MQSLENEVDTVAEDKDFSGVVHVDRSGHVELAKAYGMAHVALQVPNAIDTQFAIASAVKGMTAVAVVSLVDDGLLELSTPARAVLGGDLPCRAFLVGPLRQAVRLNDRRVRLGIVVDQDDGAIAQVGERL